MSTKFLVVAALAFLALALVSSNGSVDNTKTFHAGLTLAP
jgi:hypothetical protein